MYTKGGPLDTTTEYNKQYIKKKTDSCHVPLLDNTKGKELGYEFSETDDTGHRWYSRHRSQVVLNTGHRWYSFNKTLFVATAAGKFLDNAKD